MKKFRFRTVTTSHTGQARVRRTNTRSMIESLRLRTLASITICYPMATFVLLGFSTMMNGHAIQVK